MNIIQFTRERIPEAVEFFACNMAETWPQEKEEIALWVKEEFAHPFTHVIGIEDDKGLVATLAICPFHAVLDRLPERLRQVLWYEIERKLRVDQTASELFYAGGLAVRRDKRCGGYGRIILSIGKDVARAREAKFLVAQTAYATTKHPGVKALPWLTKHGWKILSIKPRQFYPNQPTLERAWITYNL